MTSSKPKKEWKYMYFGYVVRQEWILDYGISHGMIPDMTGKDPEEYDEVESIKTAALINILARARLTFSSQIGSVLSTDGEPLLCIVLGTNDPLDNLPRPRPKKWAKLKEILETDEEPHWYLASM